MQEKIMVSVIIPAYNEEQGLHDSIAELHSVLEQIPYPNEVIVVDDGSLDRTAELARAEHVQLLTHLHNLGYGASLKTGIKYAQGEWIVITDADGTYPARYIPQLLAYMSEHGYDMAVGARTGENVNVPLVRRPAKWIITQLASYLTGFKIPDLNSGLRVFRRDLVEKFLPLLPDGFSFTTTITLASLVNGYKVWFEPIDYLPRVGRSKIKPARDTFNFIILILRTVMFYQPLKVFLPLSFLLFLLGLAVLFGSYLFTPKVMDTTVIVIFMTAIQMFAIGMLADLITRTRS